MRHALALTILLFAHPAAAQLEIAADTEPLPVAEPVPQPAESDLGIAMHAGLRGEYGALTQTQAAYEAAMTIGATAGIVLEQGPWRMLDFRLNLYHMGAAWGPDTEFAASLGVHFGTGLHLRAGFVSFAATALAGITGWIADAEMATFELGGEASILFHPPGCAAFEMAYQAFATAGDRGFAEEPSHAVSFRWVLAVDGPEYRACRS